MVDSESRIEQVTAQIFLPFLLTEQPKPLVNPPGDRLSLKAALKISLFLKISHKTPSSLKISIKSTEGCDLTGNLLNRVKC